VAVPTVTTAALTDLTQTTATGGGEFSGDGVTAYGLCWGTTPSPTIADSVHYAGVIGAGALTVAPARLSGAGAVSTPGSWSPFDGDTQPDLFTLTVNPSITSGTQANPNTYSYRRFVRAWGSPGQTNGTAIVQFSGSSRQWIVFDHCIFDAGYEGHLNHWNCVSINQYGSTTFNNIYFVDCLFKGNFDSETGYSLNRMGFECTTRSSQTNYQNIRLIRCAFEPMGSQAISFDGPETAANCIVQDVLIRGSGNHPTLWPWGQGFEINGPSAFTVEGLAIHPGRGSGTNLGGLDQTQGNCNWTFTDIELRSAYDPLQVVPRSSDSHPVYAHDMKGAVWSGSAYRSSSGGSSYMTYLQNCDNNDFTGMTWGSGTRYKDANSTGNTGL
jgi:hypothetical protein